MSYVDGAHSIGMNCMSEASVVWMYDPLLCTTSTAVSLQTAGQAQQRPFS